MKDYYTLIEILITLCKNNKEISNQLSYLNVVLKFKKGINSLDYDFDYFIDNGIYLKCVRREISGFDSIVFGLKRQNESLVVKDEQGNYDLKNKNIASLNPVYQQHFNEAVNWISNNEFLNNYFLESDFIYKENEYHLIIAPTGLCITRHNGHFIDLELIFDAKNGDGNIKKENCVYKPLSIFKTKIPKDIFADEMIEITDRTLETLGEQDLTEYFFCEIQNGEGNLSSYLRDDVYRRITKKLY